MRSIATHGLAFGLGAIAGIAANAIAGSMSLVVPVQVQLALIGLLSVLGVLGGALIGSFTSREVSARERQAEAAALREQQTLAIRLPLIGQITSATRSFQDSITSEMSQREDYDALGRVVGPEATVDLTIARRISDLAGQLYYVADQETADAAWGLLDPLRNLSWMAWEAMDPEERAQRDVAPTKHEWARFKEEIERLETARRAFHQAARRELQLEPLRDPED